MEAKPECAPNEILLYIPTPGQRGIKAAEITLKLDAPLRVIERTEIAPSRPFVPGIERVTQLGFGRVEPGTEISWDIMRAESLVKDPFMLTVPVPMTSLRTSARPCVAGTLNTTRQGSNSQLDLTRVAGDLNSVTRNARQAIARVKLAQFEGVVNTRVPNLSVLADVGEIPNRFSYGTNVPSVGQDVLITIRGNDVPLAERRWRADFPASVPDSSKIVNADVIAEDLLEQFFGLKYFSSDDMAQLSRSRVPEIRIAAITRLTDRELLAKLHSSDKVPQVRTRAEKRLNELALDARLVAAQKESSPASLALLALESPSFSVRKDAVEQITDQGVLARVAIGDLDADVRKSALDKLKEETALTSVAMEGKDFLVCKAAIQKISNPQLLAKIAIEGGHNECWRGSFNRSVRAEELQNASDVLGKLAVDRIASSADLASVASRARSKLVRDAASAKLAVH